MRRPILLVAAVTACAPPPMPESLRPPPTEWQVGAAEHIALWYHGLALANALPPALANRPEAPVVPLFQPLYANTIAAAKQAAGIEPTALDRRAGELGAAFRADAAYRELQFLPLHFSDMNALFTGIQLWHALEGDPRRAPSREATELLTYLSSVFQRPAQRRLVAEFATLLQEEVRTFYHAYWQANAPERESTLATVTSAWRTLSTPLRPYLAYLQLRGGHLFVAPALGAEGRMVTRGTAAPAAALHQPAAGRPEEAVWSFVYELMQPLAADVVRDYAAPARVREIGPERLQSRTALRGGAVLLEIRAPERAAAYQRFFLEQARAAANAHGHAPAHTAAIDSAFREMFPLDPEVEQGLVDTIERALAGI